MNIHINSDGVLQMGTFKRIKWGLHKKVGINDAGLYKPYQHDEISGVYISEVILMNYYKRNVLYIHQNKALQNTQVISINCQQ